MRKNFLTIFSSVLVFSLTLLSSPATCPAEEAMWTVMVYMAGENNLAQSLVADLEEMKVQGSTPEVNVVVQADTGFSQGYAFQDGYTHRLKVNRGWLQDYPMGYNADMASPQELSAFISWAVSVFPARHYCLVLWDHGLGWVGGEENSPDADKAGAQPVRGILEDAGSGSFMSLGELNEALSSAGTIFDVIEFDACLMGMWEVAYAVKDWASYITFSQATEPSSGDPYDRILADLAANPWMDGKALAEKIVDDFLAYYQEEIFFDFSVTKSAMDTARIQELTEGINDLAAFLDGSFPEVKDVLMEVRQNTQAYPELPGSVDLGDFLKRLKDADARVDISARAADLLSLLSEEVITRSGFHNAEYTSVLAGAADVSGSTGMSIFLPFGRQLLPGELEQYEKVQALAAAPEWFALVQEFSQASGLIPDAESGEGGFIFGVYWSSPSGGRSKADLDLYVIEPGGVYAPWTGHSTPNGYFSLDSRISQMDLEYYTARPVVWQGIYIPVINYLAGQFDSWWQGMVMAYFYYVPEYGSQDVYQEGPRFMSLLNPAPAEWDDTVLELLSQNYYSDWWIPAAVQRHLSRASIQVKRDFWQRIRHLEEKNCYEHGLKPFSPVDFRSLQD